MSDWPSWLNGRMTTLAAVTVSPLDAGFTHGATVVDRCRTYRRRLFRWPDHLARFRHDCAACRVPLPFADAELTAAAEAVVAACPDGEVSLVVFATPGPPGGPPTVCLHAGPLPAARCRPYFTHGVALALAGDHPVSPAGLLSPRVKHRSRMAWWLADHAVPAGAVAVLRDPATGSLTETAVGNLLAVRGGVVVTPPAGLVLDGVSLRVARELCDESGVPFAEAVLTPADLAGADEAMLAGTTHGLAGVSSFDGRPVPWPGPVFGRLLAAWGRLVGIDVAGEFSP